MLTALNLVITGGTLVSAAETVQADLGIAGQKIVAIGQGLEGARRIDASGRRMLPGAKEAKAQ